MYFKTQFCVSVILVLVFSTTRVESIYTHSKWVADTSDEFQDTFDKYPEHAPAMAIEAPHFNLHPHMWFDAEREMGKLAEINAKLKIELNAPVEEDSAAARTALAFGEKLKQDVAVSHRLNAHIQKLNSRIQAQSVPSPFSLLQVRNSDWAYCTCGSGANGTLTFAGRDWPPSSLLQVTVGGRELSIPRADKCDCTNPWENFKDPSHSSMCTLNKAVTICLVRVNPETGIASEVSEEAKAVLESIDATYHPNSFVELWKPFQFQF